eukprot:scaffold56339_cov31-Tisochrysis_lutea.AAC.3
MRGEMDRRRSLPTHWVVISCRTASARTTSPWAQRTRMKLDQLGSFSIVEVTRAASQTRIASLYRGGSVEPHRCRSRAHSASRSGIPAARIFSKTAIAPVASALLAHMWSSLMESFWRAA